MLNFSNTPYIDDKEITKRINEISNLKKPAVANREALKTLVGFIDLTTLEGNDTNEKVKKLCIKGRDISSKKPGFPGVASICIFPTFIRTAKTALEGSGIKVATVAGSFPHGQAPLHLKVIEAKYAIEEGADEIDMVISRCNFLEGEYNYVFDEIAAIKQICGNKVLKVILETGELITATLIRRASEIAIHAGGDFIKTSTGKISPPATEHAVLTMLDAIKDHYHNTGKMTGIKPAGGISNPAKALIYYNLVEQTLGESWLNKDKFRIGASKLIDEIIENFK